MKYHKVKYFQVLKFEVSDYQVYDGHRTRDFDRDFLSQQLGSHLTVDGYMFTSSVERHSYG